VRLSCGAGNGRPKNSRHPIAVGCTQRVCEGKGSARSPILPLDSLSGEQNMVKGGTGDEPLMRRIASDEAKSILDMKIFQYAGSSRILDNSACSEAHRRPTGKWRSIASCGPDPQRLQRQNRHQLFGMSERGFHGGSSVGMRCHGRDRTSAGQCQTTEVCQKRLR